MRHLTVPRPALLSLATVAAVTLGAGVLAPIAQAGAPAAPPDVNPIERVWQSMKDQLRWINLKSLEELRGEVDKIIQSITPSQLASLTSFDFILTALK